MCPSPNGFGIIFQHPWPHTIVSPSNQSVYGCTVINPNLEIKEATLGLKGFLITVFNEDNYLLFIFV